MSVEKCKNCVNYIPYRPWCIRYVAFDFVSEATDKRISSASICVEDCPYFEPKIEEAIGED